MKFESLIYLSYLFFIVTVLRSIKWILPNYVFICVSTQEFISGYRICFFLFCDSNNLLVCIKVYSLLIDLPVLTKCLLLGADSSHPIHATKNNAIINKGAHQHSQHSDRGPAVLSSASLVPKLSRSVSANNAGPFYMVKSKRGRMILVFYGSSFLKFSKETLLLRVKHLQNSGFPLSRKLATVKLFGK